MARTKQQSNEPQNRQLSAQLDRELASRAYKKVMSGETPTAEEKAALKRFEKAQEEQRRWEYYESIPQKHWREMSGRQTKVLNEQAERYGIPFGGRTIHLPKVVRALHDFLAANARRLAEEDDDLLNATVSSPALERYREERALIARLDRLEREQALVPRDDVREGLGRIAAILRSAGETLQRQFGNDAVEILDEALSDAEREIESLFGSTDSVSDSVSEDSKPDVEAA